MDESLNSWLTACVSATDHSPNILIIVNFWLLACSSHPYLVSPLNETQFSLEKAQGSAVNTIFECAGLVVEAVRSRQEMNVTFSKHNNLKKISTDNNDKIRNPVAKKNSNVKCTTFIPVRLYQIVAKHRVSL